MSKAGSADRFNAAFNSTVMTTSDWLPPIVGAGGLYYRVKLWSIEFQNINSLLFRGLSFLPLRSIIIVDRTILLYFVLYAKMLLWLRFHSALKSCTYTYFQGHQEEIFQVITEQSKNNSIELIAFLTSFY